MQGRSGETEELFDELGVVTERIGHTNARWVRDFLQVYIELTTEGDLAVTERQAAAGLERALAANLVNVGLSHRLLGLVRFFRGAWDAADRAVRSGAENEKGGAPSVRGSSSSQLAVMRACAGDSSPVENLRAEDLWPRTGQPNTIGQWTVLSSYVQGMAQLGRREEIRDLYPLTLEALETGAVIDRILTMWEAVAGMAAAAGEQWDAADGHFQTALRQAEEIPNKIGQPEVRRAYARMLIDRAGPGDKEKARTLLDEAIALYGQLGMPRHLEMARELLGGL